MCVRQYMHAKLFRRKEGVETQALKHLKIAGFGSAIVIVACWTVCQTCGLDAGQSAQCLSGAMPSDFLLYVSISGLSWCLGNIHAAGNQNLSTGACLLAGPFQSLIFADSICSLASAAPLVYITKPWHFASWKIVVTLLLFQVCAIPQPLLDCSRPGSSIARTMCAGRAVKFRAYFICWRWQHQHGMLRWTHVQQGLGAP